MKKFLIAPLALLILASCSESERTAPVPSNVALTGNMVATLNGEDWKAVSADAEIRSNSFSISGSGLNNVVITLNAQGEAKVGTYAISSSAGSACSITLCPTDKVIYVPAASVGNDSGTLTITEINTSNHTLSGTFNSVVMADNDEVKISTGTFNKVPYFSPSYALPSSLTTTVDGEVFNGSGTAVKSRSTINMNFTGDQGKNVVITIPNNPEAAIGLHSITKYGFYTASYNVADSKFPAVSGTINITKFDALTHRVEGTFYFKSDKAPSGNDGLVYDPGLQADQGTFAVTYFYE